MLNLNVLDQPGERVTLITKTKIVIATVTEPDTANDLELHTPGSGLCIGLRIEQVRDRELE